MTKKLWRVSVEKTMEADFVVAAATAEEARRIARNECDPRNVGADEEIFVGSATEVVTAKDLPEDLGLDDRVDAGAPDYGCIRDFLGPQETDEERSAREHAEEMAKKQGVLF